MKLKISPLLFVAGQAIKTDMEAVITDINILDDDLLDPANLEFIESTGGISKIFTLENIIDTVVSTEVRHQTFSMFCKI